MIHSTVSIFNVLLYDLLDRSVRSTFENKNLDHLLDLYFQLLQTWFLLSSVITLVSTT